MLAFMGEARAKLLRDGQLPDPERTGLFTTAIIPMIDDKPIALFYSGCKHAGENLARLLTACLPDVEPPILMSDALNRNVPKGHATVEANCTAHARRGIVDQYLKLVSSDSAHGDLRNGCSGVRGSTEFKAITRDAAFRMRLSALLTATQMSRHARDIDRIQNGCLLQDRILVPHLIEWV